jgi:uncharacterized SAM-binding protein YcdF (DUF218 family)
MLFFLRKFIEALILPLGLAGLVTLAGILFRRRWLAAAGLGLLYLFSIPITGKLLLRPLEQTYPPQPVASCPPADAIVVLSGGILRGVAAPGMQWGETSNRYFTGFDLAMAGKAKFLVFSIAPDDDGVSDGALERAAAIRQGIPPERIILTTRVQTTGDEARAVSEIPGIHSIILVTSASHMPRAVLLFQSHHLHVLPFPTDQRVLGRFHFNSQSLVPEAKSLERAESALREYYGLAVYGTLLRFRL